MDTYEAVYESNMNNRVGNEDLDNQPIYSPIVLESSIQDRTNYQLHTSKN